MPLTEEQVQAIQSEKGLVQPEWYQVCATLHRSGEDDVRYWGTADYPVPPTVLKILTEQCGYTFVTPEDFRGNMTSAKLEFYGGETYTAAKADLPDRIGRLSRITGLKYNKLTIRASRTKWGSCTGTNNISLSLFLMTLPEHLRDFVIVHELCHTVHHDHSPKFHALVDRLVGGNEKALNRELKAFSIRG